MSEYLSDMGNWLDIMFILGSIAMAIIHFTRGPRSFEGKLIMIIVLLCAIRRTMSFLRIFSPLSTIVTMLF